MFHHGRVWLAALVVAGLLFGSARAAEDCLKYVPNDAEIIATLNFRQILGSELAKAHQDKVDQVKGLLNVAIQNNEEAKKYIESLGFDLFRDFNSITVAAAASTKPEKGLVIVDGKFDADKFQKTAEDAAKEHGDVIKATQIGGNKVWEINPPGQDHTLYVALANKSTLLVSAGKALLTDALSRASGSGQPELKKEVKALLKTTSSKQSFSFVATGKALSMLAEQIKNNPQAMAAAPVLKQMAGISAAVTIGKDIDFQVGIGTPDKEAADVLSKQASGLILFGRGMVSQKAKEDPKAEMALDVMKTLQTSVEGTTVIIRGQVAAAVLEKALKNAGQ
jgi:hypothetical protein